MQFKALRGDAVLYQWRSGIGRRRGNWHGCGRGILGPLCVRSAVEGSELGLGCLLSFRHPGKITLQKGVDCLDETVLGAFLFAISLPQTPCSVIPSRCKQYF